MPKIVVKRTGRTFRVNVTNRNVSIKRDLRKIDIRSLSKRGLAGPKGDKGDKGDQGTPGLNFNIKGSWIPNTPYVEYDIVLYNGSSYVAIESVNDAVTPDNNASFILLAEGAPGEPDKNFVLPFTVSNHIVVNHNLGKYPAVTVFDSAGDQVEGSIAYNNTNSLEVSFAAPFSGTITCN